MTAPLRDLGTCPECGKGLSRRDGDVVCFSCGRVAVADPAVVRLPAPPTHPDGLAALVAALADRGVLFRHEGTPRVLVGGALQEPGPPVLQAVRSHLFVVFPGRENETRRYLTTEETQLLFGHLWSLGEGRREGAALPECRVVVPRSILYRNAGGDLVPTRRGVPADGLLQTGEDVAPAATGEWRRFLDMTLFATDDDRRTYETWCLAAVLPLEVDLYPLLVVGANGQMAGKTWAVNVLGWALGYGGGQGQAWRTPVEPEGRFYRRVLGAAKRSRLIVFDNVVGSGSDLVADNALSALLTSFAIEADALYRIGSEILRVQPLFAVTMNEGRVCEDLATRAVGVRLTYDADDLRLTERGRLGEGYWQRPTTSRAVLAEILHTARERWHDGAGVVVGPVRRPERWHTLAWRLGGREIPPMPPELREAGLLDLATLHVLLAVPRSAAEIFAASRTWTNCPIFAKIRSALEMGQKLGRNKKLWQIQRIRKENGDLWQHVSPADIATAETPSGADVTRRD